MNETIKFSTVIITDVRIFKINEKYFIDDAFYKILERYYNNFKNITLITRIISTNEMKEEYKEITNFCCNFLNIKSIFNSFTISLNTDIVQAIKKSDFVILRVHSLVSIALYRFVRKFHKTYMTEIIGCAWDGFWNHGILGKIVAPYAFFMTKRIVKNSNYSIYVTKKFLQRRYPCSNYNVGISDVNITKVYTKKDYSNLDKQNISLLTAAAVNVRYKGQQYVIKAIKKLKKIGINATYYLAGAGDQSYLKKIAKKYNVEKDVVFLGSMITDDLIEKMKQIDFYIQPSLQEGLPRSVIEAMSVGTVCFGSRTAGIPELLNEGQIFERKDADSIVRCVKNNIYNVNLNEISKENVEKATEYLSNKLNKKRDEFYTKIIRKLNNA